MTIQAKEKLKYDGKVYGFNEYPLNTVLEALDEKFKAQWSCCWRGYVGSWLIANGKLFLEKCEVADGNCSFEDLIGYSFTQLEAQWFSGEIEIQEGEELSFCSIGGSEQEYSIFLLFKKGKLINKRKISNRTKKEIYSYSQQDFIPKKDGVYLHHFKGDNRWGEHCELTMLLFFTNEGLVYYDDSEGIIEGKDFDSSILDEDFGIELSKNLGKYLFNGKDNLDIRLPFSDSKAELIDNQYQEFKGSVFKDHLILDYSLRSWSEMTGDYKFRTLISNARFDFYKLNK